MVGAFRVAGFAVIVGILGVLAWMVFGHADDEKRILVLHSYHTDLAWVNELNDGLRTSQTNAQIDKPDNLKVRHHYMDLRNYNTCNFYKIAAKSARLAIEEWQPDAVIVFDDLAQGLVGFNHIDWNGSPDEAALNRKNTEGKLLDYLNNSGCRDEPRTADFFGLDQSATAPLPTIIYGGVNYSVENYGYDFAKNVNGITERKNYAAVVEKLIALRGDRKDVKVIQFLNDMSATASQETEAFRMHNDWEPFEAATPIQVDSFSEWKNAVWDANDRNHMLLIANYGGLKDDDGRRVRQKELIAWTERQAVLPVLGLSTRFVDDGGMITIAMSGKEQGRVAMEMALRSIMCTGSRPMAMNKCEKLGEPKQAQEFTIGLNQSLVRKRKLKIPSIMESFDSEVRKFMNIQELVYQSDLTHAEKNP